jgi:hypothetical protein
VRRTPASLIQEMLEDLYARREEIAHELKDASGVARVRLMEMIESIDRALDDPKKLIDDGPVITGDPLVDEWERAIARGEMPDLTKGLPPKSKPKGGRGSMTEPLPSGR